MLEFGKCSYCFGKSRNGSRFCSEAFGYLKGGKRKVVLISYETKLSYFMLLNVLNQQTWLILALSFP